MQVIYINLQRRQDRNKEFLRRNSRCADCCRFDAIDVGSFHLDARRASGIVAERLEEYTPRILASALSHKALWERAAASMAPMTIAEDDAVLNRRFSEKAAEVIARLPENWDIVLWGWNFDSIPHCEVFPGLRQGVMHCDPAPLREKLDRFQDTDVEPQYVEAGADAVTAPRFTYFDPHESGRSHSARYITLAQPQRGIGLAGNRHLGIRFVGIGPTASCGWRTVCSTQATLMRGPIFARDETVFVKRKWLLSGNCGWH